MGLYEFYNYLIYDLGGPQAKGNLFIETPWAILIIGLSYLYFVKVCGPKFMKNRQPFEIEWLVTLYNIIQVVWNLYLSTYIYRIAYAVSITENISGWCMPVSYSEGEPLSEMLYYSSKLYFANKIFDFMDTIFFVLRKKFSQITFLHVYHHLLMVLMCWMYLKYISGSNAVSVGLANSVVHVVMYTYYLLTILGCDVWWKKYLTQLQIVQFVINVIYNASVLFQKDCEYNPTFVVYVVLQNIFFIYLFTSFYIKSYQKKTKKQN